MSNNQKVEYNIIIYKYENQINYKIYIGQPRTSLRERARTNGAGYRKCPLFWQAIQKYGWNSFEASELEIVHSLEEANAREQYWISFYSSDNPQYGYNLTTGGWAHEVTEEAKRHMSLAQKNKNYHISDETRKKMSISHREKCSGVEHHLWGKELPTETKQKISKKLSNGGNPSARRVQCIETGEIFGTVSLASQWCNNEKNTLRSHIAQQIAGKRKSCGRHPITKECLHWRYVE